VRSEPVAKETASEIRVDGATPRVVATTRDGVTIYRVVIGPFPTRAEADRIARTSGKSYWVYEGAP
jgi:cell division protein FtsN